MLKKEIGLRSGLCWRSLETRIGPVSVGGCRTSCGNVNVGAGFWYIPCRRGWWLPAEERRSERIAMAGTSVLGLCNSAVKILMVWTK